MKNYILPLIGAIFLFISCEKNENSYPRFVKKEYFATNELEAKSKILSFLESTKSFNNITAAKASTNFPNLEPNEGTWVLEGANNYLINSAIDSVRSDTIIKTSIVVENILDDNNNILMKGSSMVTEFDNLVSQFNVLSQSLGKKVKIADYELESVDGNSTNLSVKVVLGEIQSIAFDPNLFSIFPDGLAPSQAFELYENQLLNQLGTNTPTFYTNVSFHEITPYTHIYDINDPNYTPQQDPASPLYDESLQKCGNLNGETDCRICYDCLWSHKENPAYGYSSWTGLQSTSYYHTTKTVVQNFMNSLNNYSEIYFIDSDIEVDFFVCGCPDPNYWQRMDLFFGRGLSY